MATFTLEHADATSAARCGQLATRHGTVETPVFMPVGTRGAVKTLTPRVLEELGVQMVLGNTYHLLLRPGVEIVAAHGGLHAFMGWNGPILTDSGGFQVFSLAPLRTMTDTGATFASHIDGTRFFLGPTEATEIQWQLGADIIMAFDECPPSNETHAAVALAVERTITWAQQCRMRHAELVEGNDGQALFAIVQGGVCDDLRRHCAEALMEMDFAGYAIGGLAVGESHAEMYRVTELCCELLPAERARYLMGVGTPDDIVEAVLRGVDMFDCVMPTRNARNGMAFTDLGDIPVKAGRFKDDERPVQPGCECYTCRTFSRAYIRHMLNVGESLGGQLLTIHNLHFYMQLMRDLRAAIGADRGREFAAAFRARRATLGTGAEAEERA
jgi:queuine tRNA-ribosyltransferase